MEEFEKKFKSAVDKASANGGAWISIDKVEQQQTGIGQERERTRYTFTLEGYEGYDEEILDFFYFLMKKIHSYNYQK